MTVRVVYSGAHTLRMEPARVEQPGPGQVRIAVAYTGICGTDLHIYHGDMDGRVSFPQVIGHEMSGRIVEIGDGVDGWQTSDLVTVMPLDWCGTCPACRAGHAHLCHHLTFLGIDAAGAMQTSWIVPGRTLIGLPPQLALDHPPSSSPPRSLCTTSGAPAWLRLRRPWLSAAARSGF